MESASLVLRGSARFRGTYSRNQMSDFFCRTSDAFSITATFTTTLTVSSTSYYSRYAASLGSLPKRTSVVAPVQRGPKFPRTTGQLVDMMSVRAIKSCCYVLGLR